MSIPIAAGILETLIVFVILAIPVVAVGVVIDTIRNRLNSYPCPRCGRRIKKGRTSCRCGYDFDATQTPAWARTAPSRKNINR